MFIDIAEVTKPARLGVRAEFTRRGGIDINAERQQGFGDWPYQRHYRQ
jgi:NADPH-dependent 7-cyano-7-deazaguanine reductase QueF